MATKWTIGGDAADPQKLARFWAAALGYVIEPGFDEPDMAGIIDPDDVGPAICFGRVPEPKTSKNRLHIDIRVAGPGERDAASAERMRTKAAALMELGATQVREDFYGPELGHIVMLDPEGNEFCVG
ncbi:VOC family protein [Kribbella sp. NPDC050281]|uniref:VOC family protein n=1 Tax=Kribbella sp. NPDC050281 TaxID=3155515 RepID=UPI0033FDAAC4